MCKFGNFILILKEILIKNELPPLGDLNLQRSALDRRNLIARWKKSSGLTQFIDSNRLPLNSLKNIKQIFFL